MRDYLRFQIVAGLLIAYLLAIAGMFGFLPDDFGEIESAPIERNSQTTEGNK